MTHEPTVPVRRPLAVTLWFGWAFLLLAISGLLLPRIIEFIDFSERAPFSLLGIFMMIELALVLFGLTTALQRKRIAHRFAIGIALLPVPILAGLPPILLDMPSSAANGWYLLTVPIGLVISLVLVVGLLRRSSRDWFSEA
jgi:cyanate permease